MPACLPVIWVAELTYLPSRVNHVLRVTLRGTIASLLYVPQALSVRPRVFASSRMGINRHEVRSTGAVASGRKTAFRNYLLVRSTIATLRSWPVAILGGCLRHAAASSKSVVSSAFAPVFPGTPAFPVNKLPHLPFIFFDDPLALAVRLHARPRTAATAEIFCCFTALRHVLTIRRCAVTCGSPSFSGASDSSPFLSLSSHTPPTLRSATNLVESRSL